MKRLILLLTFLLAASPAHADIYARPSWDNLIKTLVRYGAIDLSDNKILDDYAIVTDCDIYRTFSGNDFKWNQVRGSIRDSVQMNMAKFPVTYTFEDKFALDHYDFDQQMFRFSDKNPLQKVNAFFLYRTNGQVCGDLRVNNLPKSFRAVLDEPVSLPGLPLLQKPADDLLRRMDANGNKNRIVYARFNLHVTYVAKVEKSPEWSPGNPVYTQRGAASDAPIALNAQVDTIDFYEDENYKKLLYSYEP